jgi:hypothetical protein
MITIPVEIKALLTFLITQGLKAVANLFGGDFSKWGSVAVASVVGAILFFFEGILALVPPEKQELVTGVLGFIALLLGSFGTHYTYKNIGA